MIDNQEHGREDETEVALRLLCRGFIDLHLKVRAGEIVDPFALPDTLGQGMQFVSRLCLVGGVPDIADSVHTLSDTARRLPLGEWGIPALSPPFRFAEARLLSEAPAAPTEECRALAAKGQPDDAFEEIHHRQLRDIVQRVRTESRREIYSTLRERIVRSPVYERRELTDFLEDEGFVAADEVLRRWSSAIPLGALHRDNTFNMCANCGGLLYPHRDRTAFPDGRCRISACLEDIPSSRAGRRIQDPAGWRVFSDDILAYWVGPGLAEIRLHDDLRARGFEVVLYPRDDAADVGRGDEVGIDVKGYSCPRLLGETLTARLGGLSTFRERYVAVPDAMVDRRPRYLEDLREAYRGALPVTFAKVGAVVEMLAP
jgi:REase associating with pPIWI_RE/pPIWI_RE three-gene island domain Y